MRSGEPVSELTQLKLLLIEQVRTFGMTTRIIWDRDEKLRKFPTAEITRTIRSLTRDKTLEAHPLHHGRFYFALTKSYAQRCVNCESKGGPFGEHAKVRAYARLLLATNYLRGYQPLPKAKLVNLIGDEGRGLPRVFLINRVDKKLVLLRIDSSPTSSPGHLAQKLRHDVFRVAANSKLRELVQQGKLSIAFAACSQSRCKAVKDHFSRFDRVGNLPICGYPLPELLPLHISAPITRNNPLL